MKVLVVLIAGALAGCVGQSCDWDDPRWEEGGACFIGEGNGNGPDAPAAPEPAEPAPEPEPEPAAKPDRPARAERPDRPERPEPVTPASVPEKPEQPEEPEPEPEKPQYSDWANPGDEALFEGFSPEEVAMKQMDLAARRAEAEAAHQAEHGKAGGSER